MRILFISFFLMFTTPISAQEKMLDNVIENHILPRYQQLAESAEVLNEQAHETCDPSDQNLKDAYHLAFDAWVLVSHLRFGPSEQENRAFALAFWPDSRGKTPKALFGFLNGADPAALENLEVFQTVSVAARGFYALEYMIFDQALSEAGEKHCALMRLITSDIEALSSDILTDWQNGYADVLRLVSKNDAYRSRSESIQQLYTSLVTGLKFTSDQRLARPLGTFDRARPKRAEARRSERSLRHVKLSLAATQELALLLSKDDPRIDQSFALALKDADNIDDPAFAKIEDPQMRFRVEALKSKVDATLLLLDQTLAPKLGVKAGFTSLDGD
ncbi:MAG: imelysin family protein [Pseudomonadota bacterium]